MQIPIFPLNTVLFPGGPLPLRIFESRYIDMVSHCMKDDVPFGVVLIREGAESGAATTHEIGTLAHITDFYQGSDGLLGVTAVGTQRFELKACEKQSDGLNVGEVQLIDPEPVMPVPEEFRSLAEILGKVLDDLGRLYPPADRHYNDAVWVTYRFVEVLPIDLEQKQASLESSDTAARLRLVNDLLDSVRTGVEH